MGDHTRQHGKRCIDTSIVAEEKALESRKAMEWLDGRRKSSSLTCKGASLHGAGAGVVEDKVGIGGINVVLVMSSPVCV